MKEERNILVIILLGSLVQIIIYIILMLIVFKYVFNTTLINVYINLSSSNLFSINLFYLVLFLILAYLTIKLILDFNRISILNYLEKNYLEKFNIYYPRENWNSIIIFSQISITLEVMLGFRKLNNDLLWGNNLKLDDYLVQKVKIYRFFSYLVYGLLILVIISLGVFLN